MYACNVSIIIFIILSYIIIFPPEFPYSQSVKVQGEKAQRWESGSYLQAQLYAFICEQKKYSNFLFLLCSK